MLLGGIYNSYVILLYLGWFLLPVLIFTFAGLWSAQRRLVIRLGFATGVGLAMAALLSGHFLMPTATNIIDSAGIGPFTLHDTYILNLAHVAPLPVGFWLVITLISYLGAAGLVVAFWLTVRELAPDFRPARLNGYQAANTFLLLCAIIYLLPLLVGNIFDRYLIPAMPFLAASLSAIPPRSIAGSQRLSRLTAGGLLLIMIGFSVLGTRDYFSWNRARWAALADLTADGVQATMIDGGFEFNGLYLYDPAYQRADPKSWWWVAEDTYQLGFGAAPGYTILRRYPYQRWLPPRSEAILVLKKDGATSRVVEGPMREE
jgi:hypothetical protein